MLSLLVLLACERPEDGPPPFEFPAVDAGLELRGPGGPARAFSEAELFEPCASLEAGEEDRGYRNLVVPYRGHLVMPWAPEWGFGGLSFIDFDDPCEPVTVASGFDETMREPHSIGWAALPEPHPQAGEYAFVAQKNGLLVWEVSDLSAIRTVGRLDIEGVFWPDAYTHVVLHVFVQFPYVYLGTSDNGVYVVDASNPTQPVLLTQHRFDPILRTAGVFALGQRLVVSGSKIDRAAVLDITHPADPQPWLNSPFNLVDGEGGPLEGYHANLTGDWLILSRKNEGGGPAFVDLSDPASPQLVAEYRERQGSGGYVYYHEGFVFQGETDFGNVYDARDLSEVRLVGTASITGDNDTFVPIGNVAILAVDDGGLAPDYSVVVPWAEEPDANPPILLRSDPVDGATGVPLSARIGLSFNEMIEPASFFMGSARLYDADGVAVPGWVSVQEGIAHYTPREPLRPGTSYTLELLAGGVADPSGNALEAPIQIGFTTVAP